MNNAPKLNIQVRISTAIIALVATLAVVHSVNAMSAHYVREGTTMQMATCPQTAAPQA